MAIYVNGIRRDGAGNKKRPIQFDFSQIASSDIFTETEESGDEAQYTVVRDSENKIISVISPDGHEIRIDWPEGYDEYSFLAGLSMGRSMKGVTVIENRIGVDASGISTVSVRLYDVHNCTVSVSKHITDIPDAIGIPSVSAVIAGRTNKTVEVSKTISAPSAYGETSVSWDIEGLINKTAEVSKTISAPPGHGEASVSWEYVEV